MQFHIDRDGKRLGPYTLEEINQSLKEGTLFPSDLVWEEGMTFGALIMEVRRLFQS